MKKWLKITLISLCSLIGLVIIVAAIALHLIFTPARLTGIVNKMSDKLILCESHFEQVDITLFKTFPNVGLEVHNAILINPVEGCDHDTLAHIGCLTLGVNLRDYLSTHDIKVERILIDRLSANAYIAPDGNTNFDIFPSSDDTTSSEPFQLPDTIILKQLKISHINLNLDDRKDTLAASLREASIYFQGACIHFLCEGELDLLIAQARLNMKGEDYINEPLRQHPNLLRIHLPFHANRETKYIAFSETKVQLTDYIITLTGDALLSDTLNYNINFSTNQWHIAELLPLLPSSIASLLPTGMDYDAQLTLSGNATPDIITANVALDKGSFAMPSALPYPLRDIDANIDARIALNDATSSATINALNASTPKSRLNISGRVDNLLGKAKADISLKGNMQFCDLQPFLPDSIIASGKARLDLHARTTLDQITAVDLKNMKISGSLYTEDFVFDLDKDIHASAPKARIDVRIPAKKHTDSFREMLSARITAPTLRTTLRSANLDLRLTDADIEAGISDIMDAQEPFRLSARLKSDHLVGDMDSIAARISEPNIRFEMVPRNDDPARVHYLIDYKSSSLFARLNDSVSIDLAGLTIDGTANYDSTRANILAKWSPNLNIDLKRAYISHRSLDYMLQVPDLKFNYRPERCEIASANIVFGNSDYYLSGSVTGLEKWLSHEEMLRGDLHFTSNYTNVDDLLDALSGLGSAPDTLEQQRKEDNVSKEANPFIVPKDVDFILHTRIKDCTAFGNDLQKLAGDITVKDGVAILDQVGFVCKAATMQLTALYRTPRVNHIFLGMDFHLLNINISELIDMIPMVDTIVPMLSALDGRADFHLCAETYVDAFYQPKYSTLRGAASLKGDSLVVLDNETFTTIAKYLMFNKKTKNVIDSLDVQLTVFRKEVELFPFLLSMDKYQVIAAGRHNLDMNYNYHLEIIDSPLPTRLAVDALGVMPRIGIKLSKCRYDDLYRPERSNAIEQRTMEFKKLIHNSLEANVKESTRTYQGID